MKASDELKYGICDCEYPCSCVEFRGKRYGSWKGIIDELACVHDFTNSVTCSRCGLHASVVEGGALAPHEITKKLLACQTVIISG